MIVFNEMFMKGCPQFFHAYSNQDELLKDFKDYSFQTLSAQYKDRLAKDFTSIRTLNNVNNVLKLYSRISLSKASKVKSVNSYWKYQRKNWNSFCKNKDSVLPVRKIFRRSRPPCWANSKSSRNSSNFPSKMTWSWFKNKPARPIMKRFTKIIYNKSTRWSKFSKMNECCIIHKPYLNLFDNLQIHSNYI